MCAKDKERKLIILTDMDGENDITPASLELLGAGRQLALKIGAAFCAAVLGNEIKEAARKISAYADQVYCLDNEALAVFQADLHADALEQLCQELEPEIVLAVHTQNNLEALAKLGYRMGSPLISDCIALDLDETTGNVTASKPVFGDNAVATFTSAHEPHLVTVRAHAMKPDSRVQVSGRVTDFHPGLDGSKVKTKLIEKMPTESVRLDLASAVVAGGRGIKRIEDLAMLEQVASALRKRFEIVEVGSSRPLVDMGWLPPSRQIGLTGTKIRPELYIAVGISGSLQHLSGVTGAKTIVAINSDPGATIFSYADLGVVGGYEDILPPLINHLRETPCQSSKSSFV